MDFSSAEFTDGQVSFASAVIEAGEIELSGATFAGGVVDITSLTGSDVDLRDHVKLPALPAGGFGDLKGLRLPLSMTGQTT